MNGVLNIGFTGTREGMTKEQLATLSDRLHPRRTSWSMFSEFHHGDCIGADAQAHELMKRMIATHWPLRVDIVIHPPKNPRYRAWCGIGPGEELGVKILTEAPYLERDRHIVMACDVLIATPKGEESHRSGTWMTVRMARRAKRMILIIWPDGSVERELGNDEVTLGERTKALREFKRTETPEQLGDWFNNGKESEV